MKKNITYSLDSIEIKHLMNSDIRLNKLISYIGPLSIKKIDNPYHFLVSQIIGQMLSKKAAESIYNRLTNICGEDINPQIIISHKNEIIEIGLSKSKYSYIIELSNYIISHPAFLKGLETKSDEQVISELTSIKGIGIWTAKMYLIFYLNRLDILPLEDSAFLQGLKWIAPQDLSASNDIIIYTAKWKPYTSIAARYLYKAVDLNYTKKDFITWSEETNE